MKLCGSSLALHVSFCVSLWFGCPEAVSTANLRKIHPKKHSNTASWAKSIIVHKTKAAALPAKNTTFAMALAEINPVWIFCASQWQQCECNGKIRWGNTKAWKEIVPKDGGKQKVKCSIEKLGDPLPGDEGKHCQCGVIPGTAFYKSLNPAMLPPAEVKTSLVTSCKIFEDGAKDGIWGATQWAAVEAMCSPSPKNGKDAIGQPGPRSMPLKDMQDSMNSWVDSRFTGNYARFYGNGSGWIPRAFVNYYAGPVDGKHTKMTELLIQSVHAFSKEPIIVYHFGMNTPDTWTPERFPRLVLMHASPLPPKSGRSFNFNKFRAMLMSRAHIGMQLDSDQFVAPGVDGIFQRTEQEVTKDYPIPILPSHFLDRGPRDGGAYWKRYCPGNKCKFQTLKWGHAHPTWTFWALPFVGKWLRRNFRDEWLPSRHGGEMAALRVTSVPEDEDILNVGTWEEGGTKQWCKYDLPDPSEFFALLNTKPGNRCVGGDCGNIFPGVAKVFYTAHHAVNPTETKMFIDKLLDRQKNNKGLPPPILYDRNFYKTGMELLKSNPNMRCMI